MKFLYGLCIRSPTSSYILTLLKVNQRNTDIDGLFTLADVCIKTKFGIWQSVMPGTTVRETKTSPRHNHSQTTAINDPHVVTLQKQIALGNSKSIQAFALCRCGVTKCGSLIAVFAQWDGFISIVSLLPTLTEFKFLQLCVHPWLLLTRKRTSHRSRCRCTTHCIQTNENISCYLINIKSLNY